MYRLRSAFLGLGLLLAVSGAQAQDRVRANIPFDFAVGNQVLPAGEYTVIPEGSGKEVILIRANDSKAVALSVTHGCSSSRPSDMTKLVFHKLGGRYFLSQIWTQGYAQGRELPKSKTEIQLAKNVEATGEFALAATQTR